MKINVFKIQQKYLLKLRIVAIETTHKVKKKKDFMRFILYVL